MTRPVPRWLPFVILGAIVAIALWSDRLHQLLGVVAIVDIADPVLGLAVGTVAWSAYRGRRDPALAYVAIAALATALTSTVTIGSLSVWLNAGPAADAGDLALAWLVVPAIGWLAALIALAFATPWRDRRGRPPLRSGLAALTILGGLTLACALVLVLPSPTSSDDLDRLLIVVTVPSVLVGVVACVRAVRARADRALLRWAGPAAIAFVLAALASVTVNASWAPSWSATVEGAGVHLSSVVPAAHLVGLTFLLVGVLAASTLEASRMRRASDRATEVMEGRAEISATIAHDVRGPVGTIKGLATTIRKSYDRLSDPERLEFIGMIEQESARLLGLVDQVAMALKIDAGSLDLTRRTQEVAPLVDHALAQVEHGDRVVDVDADPHAAAALDTRWFTEALAQGIDNAIRFSPDGAPVTVSARTEDDAVIVDVIDRGPGVPANHREAMFEKFSRWRPAGYEDRTGTGLGLFIARGIARAHGGDALLIDGPDGGTMLRLRVPTEEVDR